MKSKVISVEVLSAANLTEKYASCIEPFIKFWIGSNKRSSLSFTPKVVLISDHLPGYLKKYKNYIELFYVESVSDVFLSQVIRLFYPGYSDKKLVITTDIDMLPLSNRAFSQTIDKHFNNIENKNLDTKFIVFRNVLKEEQIPMCYNIASPIAWQKLFQYHSKDELKSKLRRLYYGISNNYDGVHGGKNWYFDQQLLFDTLESKGEDLNIVKLDDSDTAYKRLDRVNYKFPFYWFILPLILFNYYDDYHVHHPLRARKIWIFILLINKRINRFVAKILGKY